jgi:cytochrome c553
MKRLLTVIAGLAVLGVLGFFALAWRPAIEPVSPPPLGSFAPDLVAKGEALSGGGFCAECHTAKGGQKYAGGYPMQTPFGILYSTNITPDSETGIGTWSEAAFARAMHEGVGRDGSHLFPTNLIQVVLRGVSASEGIPGVVMPSFAHGFSDADIARIAAYLRRTRTNLSPWPELEAKIAAIRREVSATQ